NRKRQLVRKFRTNEFFRDGIASTEKRGIAERPCPARLTCWPVLRRSSGRDSPQASEQPYSHRVLVHFRTGPVNLEAMMVIIRPWTIAMKGVPDGKRCVASTYRRPQPRPGPTGAPPVR